MGTEAEIRTKYRALAPTMNERVCRLWAGTEARALGHGGIALEARATGLARNTIWRGLQELARPTRGEGGRGRGHSLQANRKTQEGSSQPDRNAQFTYLNAAMTAQLQRGPPAISVDTKKKELVGRVQNAGRTRRPTGAPE